MKRIFRKIAKVCSTPEDYVFTYINGASIEADIRRMEEYVKCVKKVKKYVQQPIQRNKVVRPKRKAGV